MTYHPIMLGMAATAALMLQAPVPANGEEVQVLADRQWYQDREWLWIAEPTRNGYYGVRVAIGDLDLTASKGQAALKRRVNAAVDRSCWVLSSSKNGVNQFECDQELRGQFRSKVATAIASAESGRQIAFLNAGSLGTTSALPALAR